VRLAAGRSGSLVVERGRARGVAEVNKVSIGVALWHHRRCCVLSGERATNSSDAVPSAVVWKDVG